MPDTAPPPPPPPASWPPPSGPRRLTRRTDNEVVGGVCSGIADYFGIDPVLVRLIWAAAIFAGGTGFIAYIIAWVLIPAADGATPAPPKTSPTNLTTIFGAGLAILALAILFDDAGPLGDLLLPLGLLGIGAWLLFRNGDDDAWSPADLLAKGRRPLTSTAPPTGPPPVADPIDEIDFGPEDAAAMAAVESILGPQAMAPPAPTPPPRKVGPPVTALTLGALAVVLGLLGMLGSIGILTLSVRGFLVASLAVIGAGLVVGGIVGRGRGLVPIGLIVLVAIAAVSAIEVPLQGGIGERQVVIVGDDPIADSYRMIAGELLIDLRGADLAGRTVDIDASVAFGELRVVVPAGVAVEGTADFTGGQITVFGVVDEGVDIDIAFDEAGEEGRGTVRLDLDGTFVEMVVSRG